MQPNTKVVNIDSSAILLLPPNMADAVQGKHNKPFKEHGNTKTYANYGSKVKFGKTSLELLLVLINGRKAYMASYEFVNRHQSLRAREK